MICQGGLDFHQRRESFAYFLSQQKKESKILKFLGLMWNPLSWVMEITSIMVIPLENGDNKIGELSYAIVKGACCVRKLSS